MEKMGDVASYSPVLRLRSIYYERRTIVFEHFFSKLR